MLPPATTFTTPKRLRSRWLRYSLRSLFVALTIGGIAFGFWRNSAERQRKAVEAIEAGFGHVRYDYELAKADAPRPAWLARVLGRDYLATPLEVDVLNGTSEAVSLMCGTLTRLRSVMVWETQMTENQLALLSGCRDLRVLYL